MVKMGQLALPRAVQHYLEEMEQADHQFSEEVVDRRLDMAEEADQEQPIRLLVTVEAVASFACGSIRDDDFNQ